MIVGELPILPKHYWQGTGANGEPRDLSKTTLDIPLGSGPYRIKEVDAGRSITYERVKDWWAKDLPVSKGQWNFDEIRSPTFVIACRRSRPSRPGSSITGAKSSAKFWATAYDFDAVKRGLVKKEKLPVATVAPMQAFAFNTRRPQFQDPRVRHAFNLAFDFEWANKQPLLRPVHAHRQLLRQLRAEGERAAAGSRARDPERGEERGAAGGLHPGMEEPCQPHAQ